MSEQSRKAADDLAAMATDRRIAAWIQNRIPAFLDANPESNSELPDDAAAIRNGGGEREADKDAPKPSPARKPAEIELSL